jgi:cell division protein FtsL
VNEEALAHWGLSRQKKERKVVVVVVVVVAVVISSKKTTYQTNKQTHGSFKAITREHKGINTNETQNKQNVEDKERTQ